MGDTLDPDMKLDGVAYGRGTHENTFLNFFFKPQRISFEDLCSRTYDHFYNVESVAAELEISEIYG